MVSSRNFIDASLHLFPVPPIMTARLRQAFYPAGAKNDPKDADLLPQVLQLHREKLRRLAPDNEATRRVQNLVEERRKLVDENTAHRNRLEAHLKIYFPQTPQWFDDLDSPLVGALLHRWPTLEALQKARPRGPCGTSFTSITAAPRSASRAARKMEGCEVPGRREF